VIRLIYNLLWPLGLLLFLPGYLMKMFRRGGYRKKFGQRIGIYDAGVRARLGQQTSIWLHAVSVGEVAIGLKLASQLRAITPELRCVLTTTTTTGFAFAKRNAPPWIEVMYSPLDFWPVMRRAYSVIRPAKIVLVEAEVWPNLVAEAHARGIPISLVNARLSPRSENRFRRFRPFVAPTFRLLDLVCVPDRKDIERWRALGVESERLHHTGSIKYDSGAPADREDIQRIGIFHLNVLNPDHLVLFGGSTHRGEEKLLAQIFLRLRRKFPSLCLFIAPRHVERVREIRKQLENLPLEVRLSSEAETHRNSKPDCVLLDRTGELKRWYGIATVVFMGKSLTAHGGQNPVEPIIAGVPVIFGPHMENFATLARALIAKNGAIEVSDGNSLERTVDNLLRDSAARRVLVENAEQVIMNHRGATARTAALISTLTVAAQGSRSGALQSAE
jgi:3-deoxy-D-manno-octulosonic-acid transferase